MHKTDKLITEINEWEYKVFEVLKTLSGEERKKVERQMYYYIGRIRARITTKIK